MPKVVFVLFITTGTVAVNDHFILFPLNDASFAINSYDINQLQIKSIT